MNAMHAEGPKKCIPTSTVIIYAHFFMLKCVDIFWAPVCLDLSVCLSMSKSNRNFNFSNQI